MVVVFGVTTRVPAAGTGFPSSSTCDALDIFHWSVELAPRMMLGGEAVNGEIVAGQAPTDTVVDWLAVCPLQSLLVTTTV